MSLAPFPAEDRASGVLLHADFSVTGLRSNPTIFDHAIKNGTAYDAGMGKKVRAGKSGEPGCRPGDNANALLGGFRLWEPRRETA